MSEQQTFLTREGLKKLGDELNYLRTVRRVEVAERLHKAMEDGEVEENAEYDDARNEQAFVEGRIQTLETMLSSAAIIEDQHNDDGVVHLGSRVTVRENGGSPEAYTIVGAAEASPKDGRISNESPLGRALLDRKIGEEVEVTAPDGVLTFKIVNIG